MGYSQSKGKFPLFSTKFIDTKKKTPRNFRFSEHFVYSLSFHISIVEAECCGLCFARY